jgi:hypothetical protein
MKSIKAWTYGQSPAPRTWQQAADALRSIPQPKGKKGPGLLDRLAAIETLLKEKT